MITAIVLINTEKGRSPQVAQALVEREGIVEAYSVAGPYDLVALVRVREHEQLSDLIAGHLQTIPGILSTNTLIAFRTYSHRLMESMWDIGNEKPEP
jgi:DNA-binding Lrp family transcriptional regulator